MNSRRLNVGPRLQLIRKQLYLAAGLLALLAWSGVTNLSAQEVSFGPSIRVDDDTTGLNQLSPSVAADPAGNIYVAWHDVRNVPITGKRDIYFSKSTDDGNTWSPNIKVNDDDPPNPDWPSLDVDSSGNIYVVWEDNRSGMNIYFATSTDGGETWTNPNVKVNDNTPAGHYSPCLVVDDSGNIYVTWTDTRNDIGDIYFAKSTDKGNTWTTPNVRVNNPLNGMQLMSCLAVHDSSMIYAVWFDAREAMNRIYFAKSADGGIIWSPNVPVSDTACLSPGYPCVDVDGSGTIYVTWDDRKGGDLDIYFAKSTDGGVTWTDPGIRVNDGAPGDQFMASLAVDEGGDIYAVWADNREGTWRAYFALSVDGGNTWSDPNIRVNDSLTRVAQYPSLDVGNLGQIYVAFEGIQDSASYDIYFSRGTVTGVEETLDTRHEIRDVRLLQVWPNPFNCSSVVNYHLPVASTATLRIYDLAGRLVRTLVDEHKQAGYYSVSWDGKNEAGTEVSAGVYFYRLQAGEVAQARKMILMR